MTKAITYNQAISLINESKADNKEELIKNLETVVAFYQETKQRYYLKLRLYAHEKHINVFVYDRDLYKYLIEYTLVVK